MAPTTPSTAPAGRHVLAELTGCSAVVLNDPASLENGFRRCAEEGGATLVSSHFHHFSPQGVSGVVVIAQSHVTVHTWPEHGYAAVDIFSCSRKLRHAVVRETLRQSLGALSVTAQRLSRGLVPPGTTAQRGTGKAKAT